MCLLFSLDQWFPEARNFNNEDDKMEMGSVERKCINSMPKPSRIKWHEGTGSRGECGRMA